MFNILFIGIGNMGFPMAGYLSQKHKVTIFNRSKEKQKTWIYPKDFKDFRKKGGN